MVEHSAVNRVVVGSEPYSGSWQGSMVKRLRHRPFTAVTGVQIPVGVTDNQLDCLCRCGSIGRAADL